VRGEFIYYVLLIISGIGIGLALEGYFSKVNFNRTKIKDTSVFHRIPIIRKLAEKVPYYTRIIPLIATVAVFFTMLLIYICFWVYPILVASFLSSPWAIGVGIVYLVIIAMFDITI